MTGLKKRQDISTDSAAETGHDRDGSPKVEYQQAVWVAGFVSSELLPDSRDGDRDESETDANDGRGVHTSSVSGESGNEKISPSTGVQGKSQENTTVDAADGLGLHRTPKAYHRARAWP